ncbi:hypothetical protein FPOAC2_02799 [Fusarium poae]|uniref:hypothetical protein n=1 Tax=Fusarium poae TaxID=36050 RepID=UPI001CEB6211|nr:hypothetical protein FPOAC1_002702 [Fusarium poae]KAG8676695.1 hypothetical protein FPOAC1_002702 [Fusarium poae]
MLRSINRLAKPRVLVTKDGLTRTSLAKSYSTETPQETHSISPDEETLQEALEQVRMFLAVVEEREKSAAEKVRIRSAVEKARLQRKAIEANKATKVTALKTTAVKGVVITRAAAKAIATKGVTTRNIPIRSVPIKPTTTLKDAAIKSAPTKAAIAKDITEKNVIAKNTTAKDTAVKNSTIKATVAEDAMTKIIIEEDIPMKNDTKKTAVSKDKSAKKVITKDAVMKKAAANIASAKDVTAKDTTTAADDTTAAKVGSSSPFRSSRPIGVVNKLTPNRIRQQAHTKSKISRKRSRNGKPSLNGPPSEPPLLSELPELTFQPGPSAAEEELGEEEPTRKPLPKQKPLAEDNYWRLRKENHSEEHLKNLQKLKSMSKEKRNEHVKETYGWSLEVPYSRELYYTSKNRRMNPILHKRFVALQQLRLIMGYSTETSFKEDWLEDLPHRLRKTSMRDVRLICIDTDRVRRLPYTLKDEIKRRVTSFHLGVSILDTRDIRDVVLRSINLPNPADLIKTYEFAVQTEVSEPDNFMFGKTQAISLDGIKKKFVEWQHDRTVIGVAYSARNDYVILRDFGVFLDHIYWLDLCQATYLIVQQPQALSLRILLEILGIRYSKLHSAGNDAHFTLRALLGLAVLDVTNELQHGACLQPWYQLAARIAKAPLPLTELEELRQKERRLAEVKSATINWSRKAQLSNTPLPYPGQD